MTKTLFFLVLTLITQNLFAQCFVKIESGEQHTMAIADDGTLWGWGSNSSGECGVLPNQDLFVPTQVGTFDDWIDLDCGPYHSIALRSNGDVYTMGYNNNGQCGTGNTTNQPGPILVFSGALNVAAGKGYSSYLIKSDSTLWACGLNNGRFGDGTTTSPNVFTQVSSATNWVDIAGGLNHTIALNSLGELYTSGENLEGQLGLGNYTNTTTRQQVNVGGNPPMISASGSISAGIHFSMYLDIFGQVRTSGSNGHGRLGIGNTGVPNLNLFYTLSLQNMSQVKAGYTGAMAWNATSFYAWGQNNFGIITGTGNAYAPVYAWYTDTPIDASMALSNIAVISDGEGVYNWGLNDRGNCGDGTNIHRTVPQLNNSVCPNSGCAISSIAFVSQTPCDPQTNTYTHTFEVHYQDDPGGNISANGQIFPVTGSPQTITLTGLIADGNTVPYILFFENDTLCEFTTGPGWTAPVACDTTNSLFKNELAGIKLFPNPSNNQLNVELLEPAMITIRSTDGKIMYESEMASKFIVDVSTYSSGIYFIDNQNGALTKFIKL